MNLCSDKHKEVCYEGRDCPACVEREAKECIIEDLAFQKRKASDLEDQVFGLKERIEDLTREPIIDAIRKATLP